MDRRWKTEEEKKRGGGGAAVSPWDRQPDSLISRAIFDSPCPRHTRELTGNNLELVYIRIRLEVKTCEKELGRLDFWWR